MGFNIAIDGPAGAGKSTIAKAVAAALGYLYVDTGALYRAIACYTLEHQLEPAQRETFLAALESLQVTLKYVDNVQRVYVNGRDVTTEIRREAVGNRASGISALPEVREKLLDLQRELARTHDVVMDGRDIGTNILPQAQVKIYLTASADTRAKRRFLELAEQGRKPDLAQIKADIIARDERDMTRAIAPLKQAADAYYLDSSELTIEAVVDRILTVCKEAR